MPPNLTFRAPMPTRATTDVIVCIRGAPCKTIVVEYSIKRKQVLQIEQRAFRAHATSGNKSTSGANHSVMIREVVAYILKTWPRWEALDAVFFVEDKLAPIPDSKGKYVEKKYRAHTEATVVTAVFLALLGGRCKVVDMNDVLFFFSAQPNDDDTARKLLSFKQKTYLSDFEKEVRHSALLCFLMARYIEGLMCGLVDGNGMARSSDPKDTVKQPVATTKAPVLDFPPVDDEQLGYIVCNDVAPCNMGHAEGHIKSETIDVLGCVSFRDSKDKVEKNHAALIASVVKYILENWDRWEKARATFYIEDQIAAEVCSKHGSHGESVIVGAVFLALFPTRCHVLSPNAVKNYFSDYFPRGGGGSQYANNKRNAVREGMKLLPEDWKIAIAENAKKDDILDAFFLLRFVRLNLLGVPSQSAQKKARDKEARILERAEKNRVKREATMVKRKAAAAEKRRAKKGIKVEEIADDQLPVLSELIEECTEK